MPTRRAFVTPGTRKTSSGRGRDASLPTRASVRQVQVDSPQAYTSPASETAQFSPPPTATSTIFGNPGTFTGVLEQGSIRPANPVHRSAVMTPRLPPPLQPRHQMSPPSVTTQVWVVPHARRVTRSGNVVTSGPGWFSPLVDLPHRRMTFPSTTQRALSSAPRNSTRGASRGGSDASSVPPSASGGAASGCARRGACTQWNRRDRARRLPPASSSSTARARPTTLEATMLGARRMAVATSGRPRAGWRRPKPSCAHSGQWAG